MLFKGSTDTPLREVGADRLSLTHYALGLSRFIESCETPMTIGVQGEWGSGKTSLMSLVHAELKKRSGGDNPVFIDHWFDTWQYGAVGNADMLGLRLLEDLTRSIEARAAEDNLAVMKAAQGMWRAARQLAPGMARAVVAGGTSTLTGGVVDGATLVSSMGGGGAPVPIAEVKKNFRALVQATVAAHTDGRSKKAGARVVVFIDDLDRIRPGRAVALLEILKNFMDVEDTVFVVACDYDVVREGVKELMGIEDPAKVNAFFHKIFQVPFEMPSASYTVEPMLREWMQGKMEGRNAKARGAAWAKKHAPLVEVALGTNPRAFKRFLNTIDLQCAVDKAFDEDAGAGGGGSGGTPGSIQDWSSPHWVASLLGMFSLQTRWPEVFAYLLYDCLSEASGPRAARRFERSLRTLTGQWTGWAGAGATDEEDSLEEPDEQLQAILRRTYAGDTLDEKWSVHPAVQDLAEFASLWFAALDQQASPDDGAGSLSPDELVYLWRWSRRILSQRGAKHTGTGKWAFQDAVRKADPVSSDAFLGLLDSLEQWSRANPRLTSFYARSGLAVKLEGASGRSQNFVVAEQDGKKLLLKVRAAAGSDAHWGLQGAEALGAQLQAELAPLGFATTARYGYLRFVFNGPGGTGHKDGDRQQMGRVMSLFKTLLDRTATLPQLELAAEAAERESAEAG